MAYAIIAIVCFLIGAFVGAMVMACLVIAREHDELFEERSEEL